MLNFQVYENSEQILKQNDGILRKPPGNNIPFSIVNAGDKNKICQKGCEGDYNKILDALDKLWKEQSLEYELFFLVQGQYAVAAGVIYSDFKKRVEALKR